MGHARLHHIRSIGAALGTDLAPIAMDIFNLHVPKIIVTYANYYYSTKFCYKCRSNKNSVIFDFDSSWVF